MNAVAGILPTALITQLQASPGDGTSLSAGFLAVAGITAFTRAWLMQVPLQKSVNLNGRLYENFCLLKHIS
jgi:hypothetical protein